MDYIIKLDNREKDLIKLFEIKEHSFILENLDIGDIQFIDNKTNELLIIIERKTLADLCASIKDGRYKEQKERLLHSVKNTIRKIILIEGESMNDFTLPHSALSGVIINTMIRDNIHIYITKNINETVEFIENIILYIPKYYENLYSEIVLEKPKIFQNEYNCSTTKKENITPQICFRNMLSQIPGISYSIASIFVEKYNNMENFIINLKEESNNEKSNIIKLIANEKYGKNNRRIGEKIAEKIFLFIFNVIDQNSEIEIKEVKTKKKYKKNIIETNYLFT